MANVSTNDQDQDDTRPTGPGGGATGTPGRPGGGSDVSGNTSNQPRLVMPAGTSTANEPRPEDFM